MGLLFYVFALIAVLAIAALAATIRLRKKLPTILCFSLIAFEIIVILESCIFCLYAGCFAG